MSEESGAVAVAVAAILDTPLPDVPGVLADIARLRSATRRVLEGGLPFEEEERFLRPLARLAARCELPLWALDAMLTELRDPEAIDAPPLSEESASRRLRSLGYERCPVCSRLIHQEITVRRWSRERRRHAEEMARRRVDPLAAGSQP
jgi:hypothetical protein